MNLLILGAGGHGHVVREIAQLSNKYENIDFLDDQSEKAIGKLNEHKKFFGTYDAAFVAIGNPEVRQRWQEVLTDCGYEIPILIHPTAIVSKSAEVGCGSVIMAGAIVQPRVTLEKGCIVSAGAVVDHDAIVGNYCHVNVSAIVPSMSAVEARTKIGYGMVYQQ